MYIANAKGRGKLPLIKDATAKSANLYAHTPRPINFSTININSVLQGKENKTNKSSI